MKLFVYFVKTLNEVSKILLECLKTDLNMHK